MTVTMSDLYTSRTERTAAIVSRQEPVVYPDPVGSQPLNKSQLREYEDNGFLLLPDLFNAQEVQALLGIAAQAGLIAVDHAQEVADAYRALRRRQHALRLEGAEKARVPQTELTQERQAVTRLWDEVLGY